MNISSNFYDMRKKMIGLQRFNKDELIEVLIQNKDFDLKKSKEEFSKLLTKTDIINIIKELNPSNEEIEEAIYSL